MTDTTAATTPAGWYVDPLDPAKATARYWDGAAWTEHTAPLAPPAAEPVAPAPTAVTPQAPAPQRTAPLPPARQRNVVAIVAAAAGVLAAAVAAAQFVHAIPATADLTPWWWAAAALVVPVVLGVVGLRRAAWTQAGKAISVVAIVLGLVAGGVGGWMQWQRHTGEQQFLSAIADVDSKQVQPLSDRQALTMGWRFCEMVRADEGTSAMTSYVLAEAKGGLNAETMGATFGSAEVNLCPDQADDMETFFDRWQKSLNKADGASLLFGLLGS
ncbi:DUF2510 domain-containing protein [Curtobacterium sp. MCSS17_016]|uniref:DUF2510 domain-containing protein n=1 Tax=Curtobacterium sp. MCSS17_016 TaxID=2175644 RepID=UPI000DAA3877|nr:DUF2510 domain-containing protein [Curtobacterium sp. MCSS17_016]WIE81009.1 DUF2510 domain-containing protein [Curtobacterium sp. MCSS17_016]